jgi:hypothetical protein
MKNYKRLSLWPSGNVMVEDDSRVSHYHHVTPASYRRISDLSWNAERRGMKQYVSCGAKGLLFVAIDRGRK